MNQKRTQEGVDSHTVNIDRDRHPYTPSILLEQLGKHIGGGDHRQAQDILFNLVVFDASTNFNFLNDSNGSTPLTTGNSCFAECRRHSAKTLLHSAKALGKFFVGKGFFAECFLLSTR